MSKETEAVGAKIKRFLCPPRRDLERNTEYIKATYGERKSIKDIREDILTDIRNTIASKSDKSQYSMVWEIDTNLEGLEQAIKDYLSSRNMTVIPLDNLNLAKKTIFITWLPLLKN